MISRVGAMLHGYEGIYRVSAFSLVAESIGFLAAIVFLTSEEKAQP